MSMMHINGMYHENAGVHHPARHLALRYVVACNIDKEWSGLLGRSCY